MHTYCIAQYAVQYFYFLYTHTVSSTVPTFSSLSSMTGSSSTFGRGEGGRDRNPVEKEGEEGKMGGEKGGGGSGGEEGGVAETKVVGAGASSSSAVPVLLPEVQRVTGEEGEMKIVQVFNTLIPRLKREIFTFDLYKIYIDSDRTNPGK